MTKEFRERYAREEVNYPLIAGVRHCMELPNGWFVTIDMRDDTDPWNCKVLDSTGCEVGEHFIPTKVLKTFTPKKES